MTLSWQQVAAALANPRLRQVYAEWVLDIRGGATEQEIDKLVAAGLLVSSGSVEAAREPDRYGDVQVNDGVFKELLAAGQPSTPSGPERFFEQGRIAAMPRKAGDREELFSHLAVRLFPSEDVLDETQVNLVLATVARDVPSLRRALVDYGYLKRNADGSQYWRAA